MGLLEKYRSNLALNLHAVRYEDLVDDLDAAATGVFRFLGIEADDSCRNFHSMKSEKFMVTPSRDQMAQPIYKSSRNRWKNYAVHVEPHIPIVRSFMEKYDYIV